MTAKAKCLTHQSLGSLCDTGVYPLLSWTGPAQTMKTFSSHLSRVLTEINNSALSNGKSLGSCESCAGSFI